MCVQRLIQKHRFYDLPTAQGLFVNVERQTQMRIRHYAKLCVAHFCELPNPTIECRSKKHLFSRTSHGRKLECNCSMTRDESKQRDIVAIIKLLALGKTLIKLTIDVAFC
jgi:hypothetical protein